MNLFDEISRIDQESPDEDLFSWIRDSSSQVPGNIRRTLESWFEHIEDDTKERRDKKNNIRGKINSLQSKQIASGISEILFHELFTNLRWGHVSVEDITNDGTPDLHLKNAENSEIFIEIFKPSCFLPFGVRKEDINQDNFYSLIREQFLFPLSGERNNADKTGKVGKYVNLKKPYIIASNDTFSLNHFDVMNYLGYHIAVQFSEDQKHKASVVARDESWDPDNYPELVNPIQSHVSGLLFVTGFLHEGRSSSSKGGKWYLDDVSKAEVTFIENHCARTECNLEESFFDAFKLNRKLRDNKTSLYVGSLCSLLNLEQIWPFTEMETTSQN